MALVMARFFTCLPFYSFGGFLLESCSQHRARDPGGRNYLGQARSRIRDFLKLDGKSLSLVFGLIHP